MVVGLGGWRVVNVAVIGCGYWGPNLVRTFLEIPGASVRAVVDRDRARLDHVGSRYPQIPYLTDDYRRLFSLDLDAVVVSTPAETHFSIVRDCLEQGLDVLVEKPLATSTEEGAQLVELAERNDRVMMVGHIAAYNPAVQALKRMIEEGELGELRYIDAVRVGLGLFHPSLNVIWDLAPHDIAILLHILGANAISVSTRGIACVQDTVEDVAYMTLMFPDGILAHSRVSWLDPRKARRITVVGSRKMAVYDDLEAHEKIKVYEQRVKAIRRTESFGEHQFAYHYGGVVSPYIHFEEPLRVECLHFAECVRERKRPLTDGRNGLQVVQVIEAAQRSLREDGASVPVEQLDEGRLSSGRRLARSGDDAALIRVGTTSAGASSSAGGPSTGSHGAATGPALDDGGEGEHAGREAVIDLTDPSFLNGDLRGAEG